MSQKSVEVLLGKLVTDEEMRGRFRADPAGVLAAFRQAGWDLSAVEAEALGAVEPAALERLARSLDPRLQKASLLQSET
ncbi:MAG TPA: Os1348 family NHLP clan protein [Thermoanaerobaculia bacterium]|nr:Os1348 family NHLP clan protein [Thermoanaerobaculia bacterium]